MQTFCLHFVFSLQVDEPVLVRYPDKALQYGIDNLSECLAGLPQDVFKTLHVCCGYPTHLVCIRFAAFLLDALKPIFNNLQVTCNLLLNIACDWPTFERNGKVDLKAGISGTIRRLY